MENIHQFSNNRVTIASFGKYAINNSNIPLRKPPLNRTISNPTMSPTKNGLITSTTVLNVDGNNNSTKWKLKYEEAEQKRKTILIEKEKLSRKFVDLEKKHLDLQIKHEHLETELFEKNEEFTKLSTASRNLYKEYEMLKNQYETETDAMTRALQDASQWYKENKELKRKTMMFVDAVDDGVDTNKPSDNADIDNLNRTIKELSVKIAELQTELDQLKQTEFQTSETNIRYEEELQEQKQINEKLTKELTALRKEHETICRVSELMKHELEELKKLEEEQRSNAEIQRKKAQEFKKERNVLAHRSTLLQDITNGQESMILLEEIDSLKRIIEDERNKHKEEIMNLQEKLEEAENNSHVELLEERLKIIESELQIAIERAEKAEKQAMAPPPPPPLPPPMLTPNEPPVVPLRVKRKSRTNVLEIAQTIGVDSTTSQETKNKAPGVNEDIINAIKEGKFTLRRAKQEKKDREGGSKAVSEMLNILGTLRRVPRRVSQVIND